MTTSSRSTDSSATGESPISPQDEVVVGRQPRAILWFSVFWLLLWIVIAIVLTSTAPFPLGLLERILFAGIFSFFGLLPGLLGLWTAIRMCVTADASGLRWRGMRGWQSASWPQVRNYYHTLKKETRVETENGSFTLHDLTHCALLKQTIQERAKWAEATSWEIKGAPQNSFDLTEPETFTINRKLVREYVFLLVIGCVFLPLLTLYISISRWDAPLVLYQSLERTWQTIGPGWALGTIFVGLFPFLVCWALLVFSWPLACYTRKRQNESITVSAEGILWRDAITGQQTWSPWKDVTDYYLAIFPGWVKTENLHIVKTMHGEIQFAGYSGSVRLRALIQKYCAEHGIQLEWESKSSRERVQQTDQISRVYNYRSRETRAMLWFAGALCLIFEGITVLNYFGWVPSKDPGNGYELLFLTTPLALGTAWLVWTYYSFQITTDERGITQYNGRRSKFIAWADVTEYEAIGSSIIVRSPHQTIRCWSSISPRQQLQDEIKERAVNSKTRDW